jgi:uncharacterized membrane protein YhhN
MTAEVALTIGCGAALLGLLVAEMRGADGTRLRRATKPIASACFVALALAGFDTAPPAYVLLLAGLVLGALGDVALMFRGDRWFLAGLVSFLLGHVAYVIAFADLAPVEGWLTPWAALPAVVAGGALAYLWPHLGKMRGPVIVYVAVITAMMVGAIAIVTTDAAPGLLDGRERGILLAGATLFFASDLSVARDRFVAHGFVNRVWGLPAYYAGQILLAWTALAIVR